MARDKYLQEGQWVKHQDYPSALGRIMRADNMDMKAEPWFNHSFLSKDSNEVYRGQDEMDDETTEVFVRWESPGNEPMPRHSWHFVSKISPADTQMYRVDVGATVTARMESPAGAKARDDVIAILAGALKDAGWDVYIKNSSVMEINADMAA